MERKCELSEEELTTTAEAMGYGAVKYFDLNKNRTTDYKFDYDAMCDLKGNTAVYMLYAHARICSIMRNSGVDMAAVRARGRVVITHPSELALALHVARFPEVIDLVLETLAPNVLTDYLFDLSGKFNEFYRDCRVLVRCRHFGVWRLMRHATHVLMWAILCVTISGRRASRFTIVAVRSHGCSDAPALSIARFANGVQTVIVLG